MIAFRHVKDFGRLSLWGTLVWWSPSAAVLGPAFLCSWTARGLTRGDPGVSAKKRKPTGAPSPPPCQAPFEVSSDSVGAAKHLVAVKSLPKKQHKQTTNKNHVKTPIPTGPKKHLQGFQKRRQTGQLQDLWCIGGTCQRRSCRGRLNERRDSTPPNLSGGSTMCARFRGFTSQVDVIVPADAAPNDAPALDAPDATGSLLIRVDSLAQSRPVDLLVSTFCSIKSRFQKV